MGRALETCTRFLMLPVMSFVRGLVQARISYVAEVVVVRCAFTASADC